MPNANDLNKLVEIYKETTTINALGTPERIYSLLKKCYARVLFKTGGSNNTENQATLPYAYTEILVRYDENIDYSCRIKYYNWWYNINYIQIEGKKDWIRLECTVYQDIDERTS